MTTTSKLTAAQFEQLLEGANEMAPGNHLLRRGQMLMNLLWDINPALYSEITGTDIDPFYVDQRVDVFLAYVKEPPV